MTAYERSVTLMQRYQDAWKAYHNTEALGAALGPEKPPDLIEVLAIAFDTVRCEAWNDVADFILALDPVGPVHQDISQQVRVKAK